MFFYFCAGFALQKETMQKKETKDLYDINVAAVEKFCDFLSKHFGILNWVSKVVQEKLTLMLIFRR